MNTEYGAYVKYVVSFQCMAQYITFEVMSGSYDISCPDPDCDIQGVLELPEVESFAGKDVSEKHKRFRLNTGQSYFNFE